MRLEHIAQRLIHAPMAIRPDKAEVILNALFARLGVAGARHAADRSMLMDHGSEFFETCRSERCGYDVVGGVALIEVSGVLVQRLGILRPFWGMTGFDGIRQNFLTALADPAVKAIVLDIDSPGGEVAGCFDLVDTIYRARGIKPIWAILNEGAYSAAYAIASAADYIVVPRTGGTGSIGVIWMHIDWSQALSGAGFKVTFVTYGEAKADGHPEIPLSDEALARFQSDIDTMGDLFVSTVARNRGIDKQVVIDTQAATFMGMKGVELGLADAVMAPDAAFAALLSKLS